ncbi:hypothetical protein UFOVP78_11 [uncultured Caudovirales phage]|uniref:Uncharacterized protein n=1 Tax=uncultured Caudovirales phage TaxID=2100421 RepID=A0A6J5KWA7_9CAUD|nr:hypothetical protein UFOVP78_11 [uncultured Caudovirales phage]
MGGGGSNPSPPPPPAPPPVDLGGQQAQSAMTGQRQRAAQANGRASTILAPTSNVQAPDGKRTLLGG